MIVILLLWVILILSGAGRSPKGRRPLEISQSVALRGICAVEIMIGHVGLMTESKLLYPNRKAGILFVGIFFALSGYGVAHGIAHKPEYLKHFVAKKFWRLMVPAYLAYFIYEVVLIMTGQGAGWKALIDVGQFIRHTNWYVWEQLALYAVFWMLHQVKPARANEVMAILLSAFVGIAFAVGLDNPCYGSTLCFVLGVYYYQYEAQAAKMIEAHFAGLITGLGIVMVCAMGAFLILGDASIWGNPIARNIASMSFCMIVILLLSRFQTGNRCTDWLGKRSYEIFVVHPLVLALFMRIDFGSMLGYSAASIGVSIGVAALMHTFVTLRWTKGLARRSRD